MNEDELFHGEIGNSALTTLRGKWFYRLRTHGPNDSGFQALNEELFLAALDREFPGPDPLAYELLEVDPERASSIDPRFLIPASQRAVAIMGALQQAAVEKDGTLGSIWYPQLLDLERFTPRQQPAARSAIALLHDCVQEFQTNVLKTQLVRERVTPDAAVTGPLVHSLLPQDIDQGSLPSSSRSVLSPDRTGQLVVPRRRTATGVVVKASSLVAAGVLGLFTLVATQVVPSKSAATPGNTSNSRVDQQFPRSVRGGLSVAINGLQPFASDSMLEDIVASGQSGYGYIDTSYGTTGVTRDGSIVLLPSTDVEPQPGTGDEIGMPPDDYAKIVTRSGRITLAIGKQSFGDLIYSPVWDGAFKVDAISVENGATRPQLPVSDFPMEAGADAAFRATSPASITAFTLS